MRFRKAHPASGSRPGTLVIQPGSPPPRVFIVRYSPAGVEETEVARPDEIPTEFPSGTVIWIDVQGLGDEKVIRSIGARFQLSPLALEDAVNAPQRAKSELYPAHHLAIARVPLPEPGGQLEVPQVCFVIGTGYLLTFQERRFGIFDPVRERIRAGVGPIRASGPDYLAYALIDTMVDRYYPVAEDLSTRLDDLEAEMAGGDEDDALSELRQLRIRLVVLRRIARPQREMISALLREQSPFVSPTVQAYLRDTFDHIAQIVELLDSSHEMTGALADEILTVIGQRTNEVMRVLTLMASVFIPLTFIAGVYGMNFENMPELREPRGYYLILAIMLGVALGMVLLFRRRGWIGSRRSRTKT